MAELKTRDVLKATKKQGKYFCNNDIENILIYYLKN